MRTLSNCIVAWLLLAVSAAAQTDRDALQRASDIIEAQLATQTRIIKVATAAELTAALAAAKGGDIIEPQPGTYVGNFMLRTFDGDSYATLRLAGVKQLPSCRPDNPALLATLSSPTAAVPPLMTAAGAHHWRIQGIGLTQTGGNTYDLLRLGDSEVDRLENLSHHFEVEQVYAWVADNMSQQRGIGANAADVTIRCSSIVNIKDENKDSQAIWAQTTSGRWLIEDNYLEASGENFLLGGDDPKIVNLVPADIVVHRNIFSKRLSWKGMPWITKNLFELKNARRVTVTENIFENVWTAGQDGTAILFTPRNQSGTCSLCTVEYVSFEHNIVRGAESGVSILGTDNLFTSGRLTHVSIRHNLFVLGAFSGECLKIGAGADSVTWDHNTCDSKGARVVQVYGEPSPHFVFTNSVSPHGLYGIIGAAQAPGSPSITAFFPDAIVLKNVFAGGLGYPYPATTLLPPMATYVAQFVNYAGGDYRLKPTSAWKRAGTDGNDLGADIASLPK